MASEPDEAEQSSWLKRIAQKHPSSPAALRQLHKHYRPRLLGFLRRKGLSVAECEDLVQEVFIKVATRAEQCTESVSGWIYQIARHQWLDLMRHKGSHPDASGVYKPIGTGADDETASEYVNPDELTPKACGTQEHDDDPQVRVQRTHEQQALDNCVREAMKQFGKADPERAEAIRLTAYEDWPIDQVATYLGRTPGATREYLSQCRKKLRVYLEPCQRWLTR
jgi:RNA polymerase sigma-70 factor (ECF subfamily)